MRIPVFTADWPLAFNKFSKYLGRHWPCQTHSTRQFREVTAQLLGYASVHELQKEIVPIEGSVKDVLLKGPHSPNISFDKMVNSLSLRALNLLNVNPVEISSLIRKAPWRDLGVWKLTSEYAIHQMNLEARKQGKLLLRDESHDMLNWTTNPRLISLVDNRQVPLFAYAVNKEGLMYRRDYLESMLNNVEISDEALQSIGYEGTTHSFVVTRLLPLSWRPVEDCLIRMNYSFEHEWQLPYLHKLDIAGDGQYTIRHQGLNARYPGVYSETTLASALTAIYRGETIPVDPANSEKGGFVVGEQTFYKGLDLKPYTRFLSHQSFEKLGITALIQKEVVKVDHWPATLEESFYLEHVKIRSWFSHEIGLSVSVKMASSDDVGGLLAKVMGGYRSTLETLQAVGYFSVDLSEDDSDEYVAQEKERLKNEFEEYSESGLSVLEHFPELSPYFDNVALGHAYNAFDGWSRSINRCYSRSVGFLIYLVWERLKALSGSKRSKPETFPAVLYSALLTNECTLDEAVEVYTLGSELYAQHCLQNKIIEDMETFAVFEHNTRDLPYASVGEAYAPTRKSARDGLSQLMRMSRKYNPQPIKE